MRLCHPFKKISTFKKFSSCSLCPSTVEVKVFLAFYRSTGTPGLRCSHICAIVDFGPELSSLLLCYRPPPSSTFFSFLNWLHYGIRFHVIGLVARVYLRIQIKIYIHTYIQRNPSSVPKAAPGGSCGPWMGFWIAHYVSYIVNGLLSLPQGSYFISHDFERDFQNVNLPKLTTFSEVVCIINGWLLLLFTFLSRYRRRLFVSDWLPLISWMSVEDKVISALALTLDADVCLGIEENITFVEKIRQKHTSQLTQCTMSIVARCEVL